MNTEAQRFLARHGLTNEYIEFLHIVRAVFQGPALSPPKIAWDPGCPTDEWLELPVAVRGEVDKVFGQELAFIDETSMRLSTEACSLLRVSLEM